MKHTKVSILKFNIKNIDEHKINNTIEKIENAGFEIIDIQIINDPNEQLCNIMIVYKNERNNTNEKIL